MTVQGMTPAGRNPYGLPPAGKGKKADGNPADPGFASLLAGMVAPPGAPALALLPTGENGEAQPPGLADGLPVLPAPPETPAVSPPVTPPNGPPDNFGQMVKGLVQANKAEGTPGLHGNPHDPLQTGPAPGDIMPELPPVDEVLGPVTDPALADPELPVPVKIADPLAADPTENGAATAPPAPEQPQGGNAFGQDPEQNDHRNNPDLTRGPERADQVSGAHENRPVDGPNSNTLPIPPTANQAVDLASAPPPPESELSPSLEALRTQRHEPGRIMDAISRAVSTTRDGNYTVTLRLHPEHLGEVRLQLQVNGREVHTVMEVASADARQQLESRGEQLRQNLSQSGLTLSGFSVSTGQNHQSPRERQQAFEEAFLGQLPGANRRVQPVVNTPAGAIERIRNAGRRTGRLDTMA